MIRNKVPSGRWIYLVHVPNDGEFKDTRRVVKYIKSGGVGTNRYWKNWVVDRASQFCVMNYVEDGGIKEEFLRLCEKYESSKDKFIERKSDRKKLFTEFFREISQGNRLRMSLGHRSVFSSLKSSVNWFYWDKRKPPVFKNEKTLSRLVYRVPVNELRERVVFSGSYLSKYRLGGICVTPWIVPYRYLLPELKELVDEKEVKDLDRIQHEWDLRLNSDFGGVVQQLEKTAKEVYQLGKPQYLAAEAAREAAAEAAREAADADPLASIFD